ncbi:MAG: hypothetical protein M0Z42_08230 [Actinomycetota bacterium]|jgi:hypothetical protein|nr:hypothetical protein [Actinomycetota bacterium]
MVIQLRLLDPDEATSPRGAATSAPLLADAVHPWTPDTSQRTCEIGRRGVEQARRALAAAVARSSAA